MSDANQAFAALDKHQKILAAAAVQRGVPSSVYLSQEGRWMLRVQFGGAFYHYFQGALMRSRDASGREAGPHIDGIGAEIAQNKALTHEMLAAARISIPRGRSFQATETAKALDYAVSLGNLVCIKPLDGKNAKAVYPALSDPAAISLALSKAAKLSAAVIVQESVGPAEMRYLYAAPHIVALKTSRQLVAIGDGLSTVEALLEAINDERRRRALPSHEQVVASEDMQLRLAAQGLDFRSVPEKGRKFALTWTGNGVAGGISSDGRGVVHPSYAAVAKAAFEAIPGFRYGAVDMMVKSFKAPARRDNYWILELNASPGIANFRYPWEGTPQDPGGAIIDFLAAETKRPR